MSQSYYQWKCELKCHFLSRFGFGFLFLSFFFLIWLLQIYIAAFEIFICGLQDLVLQLGVEPRSPALES